MAVIEALLALQYDQTGAVWHGTFARFAEWPEPTAEAVEWDDYDPNWRQFLGTTWLVILREFETRCRAPRWTAWSARCGCAWKESRPLVSRSGTRTSP